MGSFRRVASDAASDADVQAGCFVVRPADRVHHPDHVVPPSLDLTSNDRFQRDKSDPSVIVFSEIRD